MASVSILPHEIHTVAVLVPEGAFVGQGAVGDGDVVVVVVGGEGSALVVRQRVAWQRQNVCATGSAFRKSIPFSGIRRWISVTSVCLELKTRSLA